MEGRRKRGDVVTKPSLEEEMARFKAISRQIFTHEIRQEKAPWFKMEQRKELRR